jgi:hypothetical protein
MSYGWITKFAIQSPTCVTVRMYKIENRIVVKIADTKKIISIPFISPLSAHGHLLYAGQETCPASRKTPGTCHYSENMRGLTHPIFVFAFK